MAVFVFFVVSPAQAFGPPFIPEAVQTSPQLWSLYESFSPAQVIEATDGVYVARGYNRDNPVLIDGPDGLVVIDPGESINASLVVKQAFNDHLDDIFNRKPVKAVIYTHHHDCHIHGASVFAGPGTAIIAHENLMDILYYDWFGQLYPSRRTGGTMMSGALFASEPRWFSGGGLFCTQIHGPSGFLPPNVIVKDNLEMNIAGLDFIFYSAPGETRDVLVVWLPEKKTLIQIANLYEAMPAFTTLRGAYARDPLSYIQSIDLYRSLNPEYLVLCHGPHPAISGKATINQLLTNYRDAIQFIHDQTVQGMNKGLTAGEIKDIVKLPPHLANDLFLQETYGQVDRNIREIFWWYRGYFSGKCRDLYIHSPQEEAEMAAELAGGVEALAAKAQSAMEAGKLEWALLFADNALLLDPQNTVARATKNATLISLAETTINAQTRNYLLSEYLVETKQAIFPPAEHPKLAFKNMDDHAVGYMSMKDLFRIMAVNLNAEKSVNVQTSFGLYFNDLSTNIDEACYTLEIRKGILEAIKSPIYYCEFIVIADSSVWKNIVLGKVLPRTAVESGQAIVFGAAPEKFYEAMRLFD
ncbi:MAG: MBL fold metallo-hydrolase [Deltaproteobacteria bacterium]|nr:MBL fold metallo-hydrolase [Deltaproteobacteria bacterium]